MARKATISGIVFVVLILLPTVAVNAASYFEFNPDSFQTSALNISGVNNPKEIFLPLNEFLGGMDLWLSNTGAAGSMTLVVRDAGNNIVAQRTISVPSLTVVDGGHRFYAPFNNQIQVNGSERYTVSIVSSMPGLNAYYANRIDYLGHNAPAESAYINGAAVIGGEEKEYSFKFALHENSENLPPEISNVSTDNLSPSQTKIEFNTNEPVDYKIDFSPAGQSLVLGAFTGTYNYCTPGVAVCDKTLDVLPNTSYQYILTVKDVWNNQSTYQGYFTSAPDYGATPAPLLSQTPLVQSATPIPSNEPSVLPVITGLRVAALTDRAVAVSWHTNKPANSFLLISYGQRQITITNTTDSQLELEHYLVTGNFLFPDTQYYANVTSADSQNQKASASIPFTTLKSTELNPSSTPLLPPPPTDGEKNNIQIQGGGLFGDTRIEWNVPANQKPVSYRVDVIDKNNNVVSQTYVPGNIHEVVIPDMPKGEKTVIVYEKKDVGFQKIGPSATFTIDPLWKRLLKLWWAFIPVFAGIGWLIWKRIHPSIIKPKVT
jgi:hypothetical protein